MRRSVAADARSMISHTKDAAIIRTRKIWWERGTRPNNRLLAHPSALVRRSPANRPANPKIEMRMVMLKPPFGRV